MFPSGGAAWGTTRTWVGGVVGSTPCPAPTQDWGWAYQILPFIEQANLYNNSSDVLVAATPVKTYFCPALRGPTVFPYTQSAPNGNRAMIDYAGNGGSYWSTSNDGPLRPASSGPTTFASISDGTSTTLLAGEKLLDRAIALTQSNCDDDQGFVDGWDNDTIACATNAQGAAPMPPKFGSTNTGECGYIFGGLHTATMTSVFCDGSVHNISYSINPTTWLYLCGAMDGMPVDSSQF